LLVKITQLNSSFIRKNNITYFFIEFAILQHVNFFFILKPNANDELFLIAGRNLRKLVITLKPIKFENQKLSINIVENTISFYNKNNEINSKFKMIIFIRKGTTDDIKPTIYADYQIESLNDLFCKTILVYKFTNLKELLNRNHLINFSFREINAELLQTFIKDDKLIEIITIDNENYLQNTSYITNSLDINYSMTSTFFKKMIIDSIDAILKQKVVLSNFTVSNIKIN